MILHGWSLPPHFAAACFSYSCRGPWSPPPPSSQQVLPLSACSSISTAHLIHVAWTLPHNKSAPLKKESVHRTPPSSSTLPLKWSSPFPSWVLLSLPAVHHKTQGRRYFSPSSSTESECLHLTRVRPLMELKAKRTPVFISVRLKPLFCSKFQGKEWKGAMPLNIKLSGDLSIWLWVLRVTRLAQPARVVYPEHSKRGPPHAPAILAHTGSPYASKNTTGYTFPPALKKAAPLDRFLAQADYSIWLMERRQHYRIAFPWEIANFYKSYYILTKRWRSVIQLKKDH